MSYKLYDIEDFAGDAAFRNWILNPNEDSNYFWERWIINNPDKREIIEKAALLVKSVQFEEVTFAPKEKEMLLSRIENTINKQSKATTVYQLPKHTLAKKSKTYSIWYQVAAVFAGMLLVASFLLFNSNNDSQSLADASNHIITKEISKGQKMRIFLPDGSIVILNSSSKITYPEKFTESIREVELMGEAFFEVAKDTLKPFVVKSDGLTTSVLGTSFNISSYSNSDIISVSLVTGKVLINNDNSHESITLEPGESAGLNKKTGHIAKSNFDYKKNIAWKDGVLFFKETSIVDVFDRLEQWYGVTIHVENIPQGVKPINGSFNDEYLNNVLLSLGHAVNFDYKINGNEVYVKFK